jgi:predicted ATPase
VIASLDLRDQAASEPATLLRSYLKDKELLLVVDNCEHLLEAAAQVVSDLITAAPGVRVIATSREPLSVNGEHLLPVPPLRLPSAQAGSHSPRRARTRRSGSSSNGRPRHRAASS